MNMMTKTIFSSPTVQAMLMAYMSQTYGEEGGLLLSILEKEGMLVDFLKALNPRIDIIRYGIVHKYLAFHVYSIW